MRTWKTCGRPAAAAILLATTLTGALTGCGAGTPPEPPPPPTVTVDTPVRRSVTAYYRYTGTLEAVASVDVRARVAGELKAIRFAPSTDVASGDPLFEIEPDAYTIALAAAKAGVAEAQALLDSATLQEKRLEGVFDKGAATEQERLEVEANTKQARARLAAAEADRDEAARQLGYARVTAPIDGRVGRSQVDAGNLVGQGEATLLTTVVQLDPIYVYFDVSERIVLEYLERGRNGGVGAEAEPPVIEIERANDRPGTFPFRGVVDYVDTAVDPGTGTIRVRGRLDNADRKLFPGLFVRIRAPYDVQDDAVLVEQAAVGRGLGGAYVLTVDDGGVVARTAVELGETDGAYVVVTAGLGGDERYVTEGIQKARPGAPVTAVAPDAAAEVKGPTPPDGPGDGERGGERAEVGPPAPPAPVGDTDDDGAGE